MLQQLVHCICQMVLVGTKNINKHCASITLSSTTASPSLTNLTLDFTYTVTEPEGTQLLFQ